MKYTDLEIETELLRYLKNLIVVRGASCQMTLNLSKPEIPYFESKVENLKDALLNSTVVLTADELSLIRFLIKNSDKLINNTQVKLLFILGLASLLEPLIELPQYAKDIEAVVLYLLKSSEQCFKYAALDIITAGLQITPLSERLLTIAKVILADEPSGYVKDYLNTL